MAANTESSWRKKYEATFAKAAGAYGARAFELGRHALAILLKALGVEPVDRVGVCAFTCLAVVEAIKVCGAVPIYLDIDEYLCIDPSEILIQDYGSLKVVILQHTFGNPGRIEENLAACRKIGAIIIEDCAHSPDCRWKSRLTGTFGKGTVCQGGMLTVNSKELLDKVDEQIKLLAVPASARADFANECKRRAYRPFKNSRLDCFLGYNYSAIRSKLKHRGTSFLTRDFPAPVSYPRLAGELKSKAALSQLNNWPRLKQTRLTNMKMINEVFVRAGLTAWPIPEQADITLMRYPLRVHKKWEIVHRAGIRGLDIAGWYSSPVHPLGAADLAKVDYKEGSCPRAEGTTERLVHIPTDKSLDECKLEQMIRIINGI